MTRSAFVAEQFVRQLEVLLDTARSAAAGLETEITTKLEKRTTPAAEVQKDPLSPSMQRAAGVSKLTDGDPVQDVDSEQLPRAEDEGAADFGEEPKRSTAPQLPQEDNDSLRKDPDAPTGRSVLLFGRTASPDRLSLFSMEVQLRNGKQRYVVQLQAGEQIFAGTAVTQDFAEPRTHAAARAALAALAEWAGDQWQFGLGDVVHVALNGGSALLVTVAVRPAPRDAAPPAPLAMLVADAPASVSATVGLSASTQPTMLEPATSQRAASESSRTISSAAETDVVRCKADSRAALSFNRRPGTIPERRLLGSALQWDDPADAAVRAVLAAFEEVHVTYG